MEDLKVRLESLRHLLADMPCDNCDDPALVAQNELLAEQAEIELGIWATTFSAKQPS